MPARSPGSSYLIRAGAKLRPLGIPVIADRCHQGAVRAALEPEWEARFEPSRSVVTDEPGRKASRRTHQVTGDRAHPRRHRVLNHRGLRPNDPGRRALPGGSRCRDEPDDDPDRPIDFALRLTGPLSSLSALTTVQYPGLTVADMGTRVHRTVPDHVLVQGRFEGGGTLPVQVVGGRPPRGHPSGWTSSGLTEPSR